MRSTLVPRALGALTAAHGAFTLVRKPPSSRAKVIAVAAGWGLICAAGFPAAGSRS